MLKRKYALGIGFTAACNMNCSFCYSRDKRHIAPELSLNVWKDFISKNSEYIDNINYGTGENALSDEWFEFVEYIGTNYTWIKQAVTTNGTLTTRCKTSERCYEIVKKYIAEIDVSIDFCDDKKHDNIRGKVGAYQGAIDTLAFCEKNGIQATIVFLGVEETMNKGNLKGLFDIARKYNSYLRMNLYRPVRDNTGYASPSLSKVLETLDWIYENEKIISLSDPFFGATCTKNGLHGDPTGKSSARITQDGKIYPSTYLLQGNYCIGHIEDESALVELLQKDVIFEIERAICPDDCQGCSLYERCKAGAVDRRLLVNKTLNSRDPYCPGKFCEGMNLRLYEEKSEGFSSVHDKYLPTLFFAAK